MKTRTDMIREWFVPVKMPVSLRVTVNSFTITNGKPVFDVEGWDQSEKIDSPIDLCCPEWVRCGWEEGQRYNVIVLGTLKTARRTADGGEAHLLGLDFDVPGAPRIGPVLDALAPFDGFWYETRSHMREKSGIISPRYRVIMAYSRPVSNAENHLIHDLLGQIGHDTACGDASRCFYPGRSDSRFGMVGGGMAADVDHLLATARILGVRPTKTYSSKIERNETWNGTADPMLVTAIGELWKRTWEPACRKGTKHTQDAVWNLYRRAIEMGYGLPTILASFESQEWFVGWSRRHPTVDYRKKLLDANCSGK